MSIVKYPCVDSNGQFQLINVWRGSNFHPINMGNSASNRFTSAIAAQYATNGGLEPETTFFVSNSNAKNTLMNAGFPNVITLSTPYSLYFSGGRYVSIANTKTSSLSTITVEYKLGSDSLSVMYYETPNVGSYNKSAFALISECVYSYEHTALSTGTIYNIRALMSPCLNTISDSMFRFGNTVTQNSNYYADNYRRVPSVGGFSAGTRLDYGSDFSFPFSPFDSTFADHIFSKKLFEYEEAKIIDNAINFETVVNMFVNFWMGISTIHQYMVAVVSENGGSVSPLSRFAAQNEPVMFTVTPDEHHAIHSVKAYNTLTNQQIPLQESGMDLLTGAKNYMFTMPAANVRIIVEFRSIEITIPVTVKYTSPRGKVFTTSFNLLYDDTEQREETAPPVEEQEGENQNE